MVDNLVVVPVRQPEKCLGAEKMIMQGDIEQLINDSTE